VKPGITNGHKAGPVYALCNLLNQAGIVKAMWQRGHPLITPIGAILLTAPSKPRRVRSSSASFACHCFAKRLKATKVLLASAQAEPQCSERHVGCTDRLPFFQLVSPANVVSDI